MNFVFIYGPPAAGKLTIASELARQTGYKLFHNHLSIAVVEPVFHFGTAPFWRLVLEIRERVIAAAALEGIDIVFTSVYEHPDDEPWVRKLLEQVESADGNVCLVKLVCAVDELERRVPSPERRAIGKIADVELFRATTADRDLFAAIPDRQSLEIQSDAISPKDAAARIISHYDLEVGARDENRPSTAPGTRSRPRT